MFAMYSSYILFALTLIVHVKSGSIIGMLHIQMYGFIAAVPGEMIFIRVSK